MFFIIGTRPIYKRYGETEDRSCERCHNRVHMEFVKVTTWFTLFFIPVIPFHSDYGMVCPICNEWVSLSKLEFHELAGVPEGKWKHHERPTAVPNPYAGKTETQIAYLKQMEEIRKERERDV